MTKKLDDKELREIREKWEALPGHNWRQTNSFEVECEECFEPYCDCSEVKSSEEFVVCAEQNIPKLLDEIERLRGEVAKHEGMVLITHD